MFNHERLQKLMAKAYSLALDSPDPSSQNGAVIVQRQSDGQMDIVAEGYNHFYKGVTPEVKDRDTKLKRIEHAERDAVYYAADRGKQLKGAIMVCPWAACWDCARAIIGSGIHALVMHRQRYLLTDKRWLEEVNDALHAIQEAEIWLYEFDGPVPNTKPILVSGKLWHPGSCEYVPS